MVKIVINKASLNNNFTQVNSVALGKAAAELSLQGLRLYIYLAGNRNQYEWGLNAQAYANWLGIENNRTVRKMIQDGMKDLEGKGYLEKIGEEKFNFFEVCS